MVLLQVYIQNGNELHCGSGPNAVLCDKRKANEDAIGVSICYTSTTRVSIYQPPLIIYIFRSFDCASNFPFPFEHREKLIFYRKLPPYMLSSTAFSSSS